MPRVTCLVALLAFALGCGSSGSSTNGTSGNAGSSGNGSSGDGASSSSSSGGPVDDGKPHVDLVSQPYTLQPGDEKYLCFTLKMPADKELAITKLIPTYGPGTHHILVSQTLAPEPDGMSECNVLAKDTWLPLYAGGKASGPLALPDGTALKLIEKGQQIVMQLHLQNATPNAITATTSMRIETMDGTAQFTPAGIFGFDNRILQIPAHTMNVESTMSCVMDKHLDVFALMGHMHKIGKHLQLSRGATAGAEVLYDEDWNFDLQPVTPAKFTLEAKDQVFLTCKHSNDSDHAIAYGESSDTEMCATVLYYTPFTGLDGCIKAQ